MATVSISFAGADKNPYFPADNANGGNFTSRGAADAGVSTNSWFGTNSSANTLWSCDVSPGGAPFSLQAVFDTVDSNSRGVVVFNSSGNGFMFIARNSDVRVFALAAWALSGSALATYSTTFSTGGILNVDVTQSTGTYAVKNGSTTIGTFVNTTYTSGLKGGPVARGNGRINSFTLTYNSGQSFDSFTNPVVPGAAISGTLTGYSAGAATVSSGGVSSSITIAAGADPKSFSGTWPMPTDEQPYPVLPAASQTFTATQAAITSTITANISLPDGYSAVTFAGATTSDSTYIGKFIQDDGFTVNGGQFAYVPYSDFVANANSGFAVTGNGTVTGWFRPSTGTGAGNAYYYTFNIQGGVITDSSPVRSLTATGLTDTGLTARALSAV